MTQRPRIAVIGGGITGLAAAYELSLASENDLDLHLFEADADLGGKILTERIDGWIMELGPDSFLSTKPWALQLCRELGIEDTLIGTNPNQRSVYILHEGELESMPEGLVMMVPTQVASMAGTPLLSLPAKARTAIEPLIPASRNGRDESIEQFITRRFGGELYRHVIEPLMSGIYAGDGSKLSIQSTFPILAKWEQEHGSVLRGALKLRASRGKRTRRSRSSPNSLFLTPRAGLASLINALKDHLLASGVRLHLKAGVETISRAEGGYQLVTQWNTAQFDGLILATPAFASAHLLEPLSPSLADQLAEIDYASTATVNLAYRSSEVAEKLSGYGYVIPKAEGRSALACTWTSTKFPHRAPEGTALVRVFIGRAGEQDILEKSDEDLIVEAKNELAQTIGVTREPDRIRLTRWPLAMPQYNVGHDRRVEDLMEKAANLSGLELAGAGYHGIGIPDCINSGRQASRRVLAELSASGIHGPREKQEEY